MTSRNASIIVIGDEILSGKTQDSNIKFIADELSAMGILLAEARIIPDSKSKIIQTVNELRNICDFVFTTGGIGPTHDDITSSAIAQAFGLELEINQEALKIMTEKYEKRGATLNEGSKKMAIMPQGVKIIKNSATSAPGFKIENVFVMAGIPWVMQAMFQEIKIHLLASFSDLGSSPFYTQSIEIFIGESIIAKQLEELQAKFPEVAIGSYPFKANEIWGTNINFRSKHKDLIEQAKIEFKLILEDLNK